MLVWDRLARSLSGFYIRSGTSKISDESRKRRRKLNRILWKAGCRPEMV